MPKVKKIVTCQNINTLVIAVTIVKNSKKRNKYTKFKLRTASYLYTLVIHNREKAAKIQQSLPPNLTVKEIFVPKSLQEEEKKAKDEKAAAKKQKKEKKAKEATPAPTPAAQ